MPALSEVIFPPQTSTSSTTNDHPSHPITWQILLWPLLTLSLNNMIQPSGRFCFLNIPTPYRIYMCSSPILCFADGLSIVISMVITMIRLKVSPIVAARYVWFWRTRFDLDADRKRKADEAGVEIDEVAHEGHLPVEPAWSLARFVVFVVGAVPSVVKLFSFAGVPWSQVWGGMFVSSFVVIEVLNALAVRGPGGGPRSTASVLRLSEERWRAEVNRVRWEKVENLNILLVLVTMAIVVPAMGCQVVFIVWPLGDLVRSGIGETFGESVGLLAFHTYIQTVTDYMSISFFLVAYLVMLICRWYSLLPWLTSTKIWLVYWIMNTFSLLFYLHPAVREDEADESKATRNFWLGVATGVAGIFYLTYRLMLLLCLRLPFIAKALRIVQSTSGTTDESEGADSSENDMSHVKVDKFGVICVTDFCFQLCGSLLWYAYRYDSTSTANPSWTDVFG